MKKIITKNRARKEKYTFNYFFVILCLYSASSAVVLFIICYLIWRNAKNTKLSGSGRLNNATWSMVKQGQICQMQE